jgi:cellulase (glycosyl hydrolase family 5)
MINSTISRRRFLGLLGMAGVAAATPRFVRAASKSAKSPFVQRAGTQFVLSGRPWFLYGAANYGTLNPSGQGTIAGTTSLALAGRLNAIRFVNFLDERGLDAAAPYDETSWRRVDAALADLKNNGLKAILDLSTYRNHLQNFALNTGSATTPYSQNWKPFIRFVAGRTNTVNGSKYKSDPTIAIVSFAGEPNPPNSGEPLKPTTQELTNFYTNVFAQWRMLDKDHLLSTGGLLHLDWEERFGNPAGSGIDWQTIFSLRQNDVPSMHNYGLNQTDRPADYASPKVSAYCRQIGKPWITEEFGFEQSRGDDVRAGLYQQVYGIQGTYGSAGVAFWNLGNELVPAPTVPTTFDTNPNTPLTWTSVQTSAPA